MQFQIPCVVMRGGTSKGPFFLASDLPQDEGARNRLLLSIMGSPDRRQINGLGGGDSLSSKVVIVSPSVRPGIDVEYLFAQVGVDTGIVDTNPNCGNMLSGVAPFAIEHGLVPASSPSTTVKIFNINTGKVIEAVLPTPNGKVTYEGDVQIDGVPGKGAGILLNFLNAGGAKTGRLLPTGNVVDFVDGIDVSCVDFSTPVVFLRADAVGKTGYETKQALDADLVLLTWLESIRRKAALRMGMGDVSGRVLPKLVLLAPPQCGGNISSRYFVPWNCHAAHAVTGALCVAAACHIPGSVAAKLMRADPADPGMVLIEHPSGKIETHITLGPLQEGGVPQICSAGIVRTARPLMSGIAFAALS
jgi:hypothetical protein